MSALRPNKSGFCQHRWAQSSVGLECLNCSDTAVDRITCAQQTEDRFRQLTDIECAEGQRNHAHILHDCANACAEKNGQLIDIVVHAGHDAVTFSCKSITNVHEPFVFPFDFATEASI